MPVTYRAPELRLSIPQGRVFHRELPIAFDRDLVDADGNPVPFDFTGWEARLNLVDEKSNVVIGFATSGEDGGITLTSAGETNLDLTDDQTAALAATVEVAGVIHAPLYGDLDYTSPEGTVYPGCRAVAEITRSTS